MIKKVNRKLMRGHSSATYDDCDMRPKAQTMFFDRDDCSHFNDWIVANQLTAKIEDWCMNQWITLPSKQSMERMQLQTSFLNNLSMFLCPMTPLPN